MRSRIREKERGEVLDGTTSQHCDGERPCHGSVRRAASAGA